MKRIENSRTAGLSVAAVMSMAAVALTASVMMTTEFRPIDFEIDAGAIISIAIGYLLCLIHAAIAVYAAVSLSSLIILYVINGYNCLTLPKEERQKIRHGSRTERFIDEALDYAGKVYIITTVILSPILAIGLLMDLGR